MTDNGRAAHASRAITSRPGEETAIETPATGHLTFRARGDQTGGALTAWVSVIESGQGPPLHVHLREDEFIYVLEGRLRFRLGDELFEASEGSFVFIPRGLPHAWQNVGEGRVRFLGGLTPGAPAMERFFERSAELPADTRLTEGFGRFASDAGMEVLGPPLAQAHPAPSVRHSKPAKGAAMATTAYNVAADDFDAAIAAARDALSAFVEGDTTPQKPLWSKRDDVTLANPLGPPRRGWVAVEDAMDRAAAEFRGGSVSIEEVARVVTAELAYVVEIERFSAKVGGRQEASSGALRVTLVFRREGDGWKIVHRHADPITTPRPVDSVLVDGRR